MQTKKLSNKKKNQMIFIVSFLLSSNSENKMKFKNNVIFLKAIWIIIQEILSIHMHLRLLAETDLNTMHNKYNYTFIH